LGGWIVFSDEHKPIFGSKRAPQLKPGKEEKVRGVGRQQCRRMWNPHHNSGLIHNKRIRKDWILFTLVNNSRSAPI
jgi:hypothetical protein